MKRCTPVLAAVAAASVLVFVATECDAKEPSSDTPACSVHLFDGSHFKDSDIVIKGPSKLKNLKDLPGSDGKNWDDEADSLKVGSAATVDAWKEKNFKGKHKTYKPGTKHPSVSEPSSLKITCD
jgi:hypothetical protein